MTDNPPPERPDFQPPEGSDRSLGPFGGTPAEGQPAQPGPPFAEGSGARYGPPPDPQPGYPAPPPPMEVPPPAQVVLPPGPYKKPWPPPPRPPREPGGKGSIVLGMAITLVTLAASWLLSFGVGYDNALSGITSGAIVVAPVALIVVGIVLTAIPRTIRTGAGILLGLGAAVLIGAGLCIALLTSYGS